MGRFFYALLPYASIFNRHLHKAIDKNVDYFIFVLAEALPRNPVTADWPESSGDWTFVFQMGRMS
jgi:hypothetical protein